MSENSAHDDIEILISDEQVDDILSRFGRANDGKMLNLVREMSKVSDKVEAIIETEKFILQNKKHSDVTIEIEAKNIIETGWINSYFKDQLSYQLGSGNFPNDEDIECIAHLEYDAHYNVEEEYPSQSVKLNELLVEMEALGIARPSTYASIFQNLEEECEFIHICKDTGEIKLTEKGIEAAYILSRAEPTLGDSSFSSFVNQMVNSIESGKELSDEVLNKLYSDIKPEDMDELKCNIWSELDQIYDSIGEGKNEDIKGLITFFNSNK